MSREIEDRLRSALSARTDRIGEADLRPPQLPVARARTARRPRRSLPWVAPVLAAAAVAAVVGGVVAGVVSHSSSRGTSSSSAAEGPAAAPTAAPTQEPATQPPSDSLYAHESLKDAASMPVPVITVPSGPVKQLPAAVLGSTAYWPAGGTKGFGTAHPGELNTNGDPSGIVLDITWQDWGSSTATGVGRTYLPKPGGGYYPGTVTIQLQATELGRCGSTLGYAQLLYRTPTQPGGPITGPWQLWANAGNLCQQR